VSQIKPDPLGGTLRRLQNEENHQAPTLPRESICRHPMRVVELIANSTR
jgi:hypothetical protein